MLLVLLRSDLVDSSFGKRLPTEGMTPRPFRVSIRLSSRLFRILRNLRARLPKQIVLPLLPFRFLSIITSFRTPAKGLGRSGESTAIFLKAASLAIIREARVLLKGRLMG